MDPPESQFLSQKCAQLSFINFNTLLDSGLHDGIARTLVSDLHKKILRNEYGHVMSNFVNLVMPPSHQNNTGFTTNYQ